MFDVKRSGLFKARLVACGYSQIPGVDFKESYAPVINDVCWRMLIVVMMVLKVDYKIIDVETAFLFGDLEMMPEMQKVLRIFTIILATAAQKKDHSVH